MDRIREIQRMGEVSDETVEAECRMMDILTKSFMEDQLTPADIVRFGQTLGSSPEARAHYMLSEVDWVAIRRNIFNMLSMDIRRLAEVGIEGSTEQVLAGNLWVNMKLYSVMLEANGWVDDLLPNGDGGEFALGDWVIKQLKDWEERTGGYFHEGEDQLEVAQDDRLENEFWFSTAERVLDIPTSMLPLGICKVFALGAAALWGEG